MKDDYLEFLTKGPQYPKDSTGRWTAEVPTENGWYIIAIPRRTVFIAEMYDGTFTYNGMRWTPLAGTLYAIAEIPPLP